MSRYEVQFKSSGIVAFSASERGICQYWMECNDYGPEKPYIDPETSGSASGSEGEIDPNQWVRGDCLGLFTLVRVK